MTSFQEQVWQACKKIPKGKVSTYKALAESLDCKAYRAVGNALNKNPYSFPCSGDVPCHRVVSSDGSLGGFALGTEEKIKLLKQEGVEVKDNYIVDFESKKVNIIK
jgi:methylated-DNA-[protein]-cysteine S-methyltransferase